jgi:hypothetical protein
MELYQLNPLYWLERGATRIHHICRWLPILWNDHDWDYFYLYKVMQFKIRCMRKHHEKYRIIANWKNVAKRMFIAENLLERMIRDDYCIDEMEAYHEKHPFIWEDSPRGRILKGDPTGWPELKRIHEREEYLYKQDLEYFLKIIRKYVRGWWD